jgi:uncharacterized protein (UPF0276 family)
MPASRPIPARAGIGLRSVHHATFLAAPPAIPWVEVHSENFFAEGGRQIEIIETVREHHGVSLHGVGLSLGSIDPLDEAHLRRLARLIGRVQPALVSEHLSWSSAGGVFVNDLLPLPCTREAARHVARRITRVQESLGRQILVENVSSYLRFPEDEMPEWEFLVDVARRSGCGILLDLNNIWVSARNRGFEARAYLDAVPAGLVGELHVAGHTVSRDEHGELLIDTHDAPVADPVWALYQDAVRRFGRLPTLLERDSQLPPLDELIAEARYADTLADTVGDTRCGGPHARVA